MTRTTLTDYETVEVELDVIECDQCGGHFDEDEIVTDLQIPGDVLGQDRVEADPDAVTQRHLCDECTGLPHSVRVGGTDLPAGRQSEVKKLVTDAGKLADSYVVVAFLMTCVFLVAAAAGEVPWVYLTIPVVLLVSAVAISAPLVEARGRL